LFLQLDEERFISHILVKSHQVIAITYQKGGCSKTSVVENLETGLARAGKKVALINADP